MERLVKIAATLAARGPVGETGPRLAEIAGFEGSAAADQLARDIRSLNAQGWQIDNIAEPGDVARYRMRTVDNRLRLRLTPSPATGVAACGAAGRPRRPRGAPRARGRPDRARRPRRRRRRPADHRPRPEPGRRAPGGAARLPGAVRLQGHRAGRAPGVGADPERHLVPAGPRGRRRRGAREVLRGGADERRHRRRPRDRPAGWPPPGTRGCTR
ncbi:hypothetical protein [Nocardioides sp. TF02-7]|uniref:hypothetical protein n=1 Tax=Nocardioides sp. TF02-7 TaxID=2917724 RepID=UPI001F070DD4|nr:hypothetical protein [Nocardioides sp. TF02-7]UMG91666.1 hypothetical protein MF408_16475 [Nocardioides sp. TF02-7]